MQIETEKDTVFILAKDGRPVDFENELRIRIVCVLLITAIVFNYSLLQSKIETPKHNKAEKAALAKVVSAINDQIFRRTFKVSGISFTKYSSFIYTVLMPVHTILIKRYIRSGSLFNNSKCNSFPLRI